MISFKTLKDEVELNFMKFLRIFRRYDHIFPESMSNSEYQKLYERANNFICTRAFGWSLPSISLIPMADSLNHGNRYLTHYLVHPEEEVSPTKSYTLQHQKANLSILQLNNIKETEEDLEKIRK
eukprot:GHVR01052312.1.p1 GENE.GHVR01052312.1~~GHVR01052312.1.p1  ORF type:complete len:124 (-),score=5.43 GHVR01052312.1:557-928(-)